MSYEPDDFSAEPAYERPAASGRTVVPGILLLVSGVLNLLLAVIPFLVGNTFSRMSAEEMEKAISQQNPGQLDDLKKQGYTIQDIKNIYVKGGYIWGSVAAVGGLLSALGGLCLLTRRAFFLAALGAIVAAIPCVSMTACFGLGEVAGIWALVVLFSADGRAAFR